jgi:arylsulfatase A-like enzyme
MAEGNSPPQPYARLYRRALYDGEIAYADSAVRQLMIQLKHRGLYDAAFIIIVGDHGESLGEHGEKSHGIFLYDATVHVPLIIKLPGQERAGTVVKHQARTIDILPTVLDLLSIRGDNRFDGESLRRLIFTDETDERPVIGESNYPLHFGWASIRSIRKNGFKFIEAPRPELYNVAADPAELDNIYEVRPATARTLREILVAEPVASVLKRTRRMDQESIEQLRALGYLGPDSSREISGRSTLPDAKDEIRKQK